MGLSAGQARCAGCGREVSLRERLVFACPARGADDADHLLVPAYGDAAEDPEASPFLRWRKRLGAYAAAQQWGLDDAAFADLVAELDAALGELDKRLVETPLLHAAALGAAAGVPDLWAKDDTVQPGGSHKVRHLFGLMLWLLAAEGAGVGGGAGPLAIASCGNAALAAALVARAAGRALTCYLPADARGAVVERLRALGAALHVSRRQGGVPGDPCLADFRAAVARGAVPFCVQGPEAGQTVDGGRTILWELLAALRARGERPPDAVVVQVGGGALASAVAQALDQEVAAGRLEARPRLYAVQTVGCAPLARALERLAADAALEGREAALAGAARQRSRYMWPWETEPASLAHGILDDETYDWLAIAGYALRSGGGAVVVDDAQLARARQLVAAHAGVEASHTGAAGVAGVLALRADGRLVGDERVAVLLTGVSRPTAKASGEGSAKLRPAERGAPRVPRGGRGRGPLLENR